MSRLDTLFRAFADYRKNTKEDRECKRDRASIARASVAFDRLEVIKTDCEIDDDWIDEIERGLVFIGKAIAEERQFIRSNGEILDIEKVKSVSKESVEHLARHSNLFTKKRKGEEIIPDRLYTVERLPDYAVYENRFLYMLLCYLRDFVDSRYEKILELTGTYRGKLHLKKEVEAERRKLTMEIRIDEERKKDAFVTEQNSAKDKVNRIDGLQKTIFMYLSVPLMEIVAKAPMLKPPITETNVLKMNKNFQGAMQTFYFISAYAKDGFSVKQSAICATPFEDGVAEEFAEAAELCSFLTYEHGMKIGGLLRKNYEEQLERERLAAEEREQRRIEAAIAAEWGRRERELAASHRIEIERLSGEWQNRLRTAEEASAAERKRVCEEHAAALQAQKADFDRQMQETAASYARAAEELREQATETIDGLNRELEMSAREREADQRQLASHSAEVARLERERTLAAAQLNTLKKDCGRIADEDFTSREEFGELERQYRVFKSFYKEEWKRTKKKIRAELLRAGAGIETSPATSATENGSEKYGQDAENR